jgi:hypothetical protein
MKALTMFGAPAGDDFRAYVCALLTGAIEEAGASIPEFEAV